MGRLNIQRSNGNLGRVNPVDDACICLLTSGTAVADKIALAEPKQIFDLNGLADLGITEANNAVMYRDVTDFYGLTGEGAELNIMLVSDATTLESICDATGTIAKTLLDFTAGRGVIFLVNIKRASGYTATVTDGLDADVWAAAAKLNTLAQQYQNDNLPFVAALPADGFLKANLAAIPARSTKSFDNVAIVAACEKADGHVSMGVWAAWSYKHQVCQNNGRVASGAVVQTAYFPDGTPVQDLKSQVESIDSKALVQFVKVGQKSGYYYYDDPTCTALSSDFSSWSWNRTINKAHRIAADVLELKINEDVEKNSRTGKIDSGVMSDWEGDVENAIRTQMGRGTATRVKEISGVSCTIDPDSDITNDQISASIEIVRNGQAKRFDVSIGYTTSTGS